jgi:O-antigen ligase
VRQLAPPRTGGTAFAGLLAFLVLVYANPGNWLPALEQVGFAKIAAGFATCALGGAWLLYGRRLTVGGWPGLALCGLFALCGFSALWSYWPKASADTFLEAIKYLAICLVVANVLDSRARLHRFVAALACASLIPAFGCISSWLRGEHLVDGDRAAWIGIFANPNDLAYHLVIGIAMTLAARDAAKSRGWKLLYLAMLVPMGVAILLTQSRGGMIAAGAVLTLWVLRSVRRAPAFFGVALALGCIFSLGPADVFSRRNDSSTVYGEDMSAKGRVDAWRTGLRIAAERPLTGVGAGAFVVAWPDFAPGDAGPARTEHNTFIQLVGEMGIPALCFFVIALVAGVLGLSRAARQPGLAPYARGLQCGLTGFVVCSLWGGIAFSWPLYLCLGAAWATAALARVEAMPLRDPVRVPFSYRGAA